jgi:hypothetical protein
MLRQSVREVIDNKTTANAAYLGVEKSDLDRISFEGIIVIGPLGGFALAKVKALRKAVE